ncbi:hypothetical protein CRYUN_Cryun21dG0012500 [Craigia yunnanensis]
MSQTNNIEDMKEKEVVDDSEKDQICGEEDTTVEEVKDSDENKESPMPPVKEEDHDHAFFDSADWALGKQGAQKPKGPLEALRPKLQPTPHQQMRSRRSVYAPAADDSEASSSEDQSCTLDADNNNTTNTVNEDQIQCLHETLPEPH